jgi:biopolymer transport protein ExbD
MAFSNKNDDAAMSEINVTPLVDVMLVLLIIFIVTAPLLTQSINVNLPETVKTNTVSDNPEAHIVTIELDLKGQLTVSKKDQQLYVLQGSEKEKISQTFKTLLETDKDVILAFSADDKAPHGEVMKIMARAQEVGILKISFLTMEEER